MKKLGIKNRCRIHEIPGGVEYIIALLAVVESVVPSMIVFLPFIFSRVFSANNDSKETVT